MPFGKTYAEIKELILATALDSGMCRDIVRRSGVWPQAGVSIGIPVSVLSESWIIEVSDDDFPQEGDPLNDPYGITWDPAGGFPETFEFWPTGEAVYTTLVDLTGYVSMRNVIYVANDSPNSSLNVRVEASLDGESWDYPTTHDTSDWLYAGCNVNFGSGGANASEWQTIAPTFRADEVKLRWTFFVSPGSEPSGALRFGYANVQVG